MNSVNSPESSSPPLVTVVTATFNALAGLRETVASVAAQTFGSVEHVIVDGGSSDGTQDYLASLGDRVRWISEADDGIADAMNKGIAMAWGEYVLVLHAEDRFFKSDSLQTIVPFLSKSADIVSCDIFIEEAGNLRLLRSTDGGLHGLLHTPVPHQGVLCRRNLFEKIGNFDRQYRIAMDYEWFLRAIAAGIKIQTTSLPLSIMPATGISARNDWPSLRARLDEDRTLHLKYARGPLMRGLYHLYWIAYRPFKFCRSYLKNRTGR